LNFFLLASWVAATTTLGSESSPRATTAQAVVLRHVHSNEAVSLIRDGLHVCWIVL
jgi:hypothetical protein